VPLIGEDLRVDVRQLGFTTYPLRLGNTRLFRSQALLTHDQDDRGLPAEYNLCYGCRDFVLVMTVADPGLS